MSRRAVSLVVLALCALGALAALNYDCYKAPSKPGDRRTNKDALTVAQYNLEWFFNTTGLAKCPGTGCPWNNTAQADQHIKTIAGIIRAVNADIMNLCEVEDCSIVQGMVDDYLSDMGYKVYLIKGTDLTGQNVAMLTRVDPSVDLARTSSRASYPVAGTQCGSTTASGTSSVSKHYMTTVEVNDIKILILGMHLLAFPTDASRCVEREAQARVIQQYVQEKSKNDYDELVILGDMNDYDATVIDASNDVPTSRVLQFLRAPFSSAAGSSSGVSLWNVALNVTQIPNRYSEWWDKNNNCKAAAGELSLIDHILVSPGLVHRLVNATFDHSYAPACNTYNSDHWPVIAHFDVSS